MVGRAQPIPKWNSRIGLPKSSIKNDRQGMINFAGVNAAGGTLECLKDSVQIDLARKIKRVRRLGLNK